MVKMRSLRAGDECPSCEGAEMVAREDMLICPECNHWEEVDR